MTTNANGPWTDYAILEPSTPQFDKNGSPIKYRVQRNAEGTWRCYCKSFIFSGRGGAVRTCKHIRHCQAVMVKEASITTATANHVAALAATKHPQWDSAYAICSAMVDQARLIVNDKQRTQMVEVLAKKLAAFVPARPIAKTAQVVEVGVRHITFDD